METPLELPFAVAAKTGTFSDITVSADDAELTPTVGGGLYCYDASPTIVNATFTENSAASSGWLSIHQASPGDLA